MRISNAVSIVCSTLLLAGCANQPLGSSNPIEATYVRSGPYATTTSSVTGTNGVPYVLFHPKNYATLGFKSPIVTWGNGTDSRPGNLSTAAMYSDLLNHFASYGFTVVVADLKNTGSGKDIGAAARYMVKQNSTAGSPFQGHLDVNHVAAVGHSQGAGGSVGAALKNPKVITAVMTFSLPDKKWASANPDCPTPNDCNPNVSAVKQPVFFISTRGFLDSQFFGGVAPPSTEVAYFKSVKGHATVGIITTSGGLPADHNSIQNANSGNHGHPGGFEGYATAWLEYQLLGTANAGQAFNGANPELRTNTNWIGSRVK